MSYRQYKVLTLLADGCDVIEIAQTMRKTVKYIEHVCSAIAARFQELSLTPEDVIEEPVLAAA